jgi:ribosomal protein L29
MKVQDLKKKSVKELEKHADQLRKDLADLKRDRYISDERNSAKAKNIRRELARTLTFLGQEPVETPAIKADKKENN